MTNTITNPDNIIDLVQGLDYTIIDSSSSQSRSSAARASRMSQSHSTAPSSSSSATAPASKTLLPDSHPIYGIVNLALLAIGFYLLWANF